MTEESNKNKTIQIIIDKAKWCYTVVDSCMSKCIDRKATANSVKVNITLGHQELYRQLEFYLFPDRGVITRDEYSEIMGFLLQHKDDFFTPVNICSFILMLQSLQTEQMDKTVQRRTYICKTDSTYMLQTLEKYHTAPNFVRCEILPCEDEESEHIFSVVASFSQKETEEEAKERCTDAKEQLLVLKGQNDASTT
jgi:hypothetical protein